MKLVLQCAMCGTHHPVGAPACATCRASGVPQMRLMFECPACAGLGLDPTCAACPAVMPLDLDDDLIVAEEVPDAEFGEPVLGIELDTDAGLKLDLGEDDGDEAVIVDASEVIGESVFELAEEADD